MSSRVSEIPAAAPEAVTAYYSQKLAFETDCSDVQLSMVSGSADFVLLDVRGPSLFQQAHIPGAINLPHGKITGRKMAEWPQSTTFVTYCAGPHCNGADKGGLRLAELGRPVKLMIGGVTGWLDEGFSLATGPAAATDQTVAAAE